MSAHDVVGRQHLRSASQWKLIIPRYRLNSFGRRCFAVAGPSTWNSLPDSLRDPALSLNIFRRQLKTHFLKKILTRCTERVRDFFVRMRYINWHFTYLLTRYWVTNWDDFTSRWIHWTHTDAFLALSSAVSSQPCLVQAMFLDVKSCCIFSYQLCVIRLSFMQPLTSIHQAYARFPPFRSSVAVSPFP